MVRHRTTLASYVALIVAIVSITMYAIDAQGFTIHRADLNDGGVWVSSNDGGQVARDLVPIRQLDAAVRAGERGADVDVVQDGSFVLAVSRTARAATPVATDSGKGVDGQKISLPSSYVLQAGGGSAAVIDTASGKLWAAPVDPVEGTTMVRSLDVNSETVADVGAQSSMAVAQNGAIFAASARSRRLTTVKADAGGFAPADVLDLDENLKGDLQVSAVGGRPVVVGAEGHVAVGGDEVGEGVGAPATVQQPGPGAGFALLATAEALVSVSLGDGDVRPLGPVVSGAQQTAAPVRLGSCSYGAWSTGVGIAVVRACDGQPGTLAQKKAVGARVQFRLNRGQLVLNDLESGTAWEVDSKDLAKVTDWPNFAKRVVKPDPENQADKNKDVTGSTPPKAIPDDLGGRPGRATVLNVLDNDISPREDAILTVIGITDVSDPDAEVAVSPNRQSVLIELPADASGDTTFRYTIDDGRSSSASAPATVVVHARTPEQDRGPQWWSPEATNSQLSITAGAWATYQVLPDWRDRYDGDPVTLDQVRVLDGGGSASVTPEGLIRFVAPEFGGADRTVQLSYAVSSGATGAVSRTLPVRVVGLNSTRALPARAQDDVTLVAAKGTAVVRPLANDLPGADPTDAGASMVIAAPVVATTGLAVKTDAATGTLQVTGLSKGSHFLTYRVGFGAAPVSVGLIRVDVVAAEEAGPKPVAAPDFATVRDTASLTVDVLANDYDPGGGLLAVQNTQVLDAAAQVTRDEPVEVAIVDGRWLRVGFTKGAAPAGSGSEIQRVATLRYTVSNGLESTTGVLTVTQRPRITDDTPMAAADRAVVRAGDSVMIPVLDNDTAPSGAPLALMPKPAGATAAGVLRTTSGQAYTAGRMVRYVAPAKFDPKHPTAEAEYGVVNTMTGDIAVGAVTVTVMPANGNHPPSPPTLEARVVSGDTVVVRLPAAGNDPDGDSVSIVGLDSAPTLGRVLAYNATSITYQAFPDSTGTDTLTYRLADVPGAEASATVRIAVIDAGAPQPPVAVDDPMWAAPGATVTVDAGANDYRSAGTTLTIHALVDPPAGALLDAETQLISVHADDRDGGQVVVPYSVSNGLDSSDGAISLISQAGYDNPPVVFDSYATPGAGDESVTVDVLAKAYDPDGPVSGLKVTEVSGAETRFTPDGKVTVQVGAEPQVLTYLVADEAGGIAAAAIYVPATGSGAPYLKPGASISLKPGASETFDVDDYVVSPSGRPLSLTLETELDTAPSDLLTVEADGGKSFALTAARGGNGPGAVSFEVTDQPNLSDGDGLTTITVPVQVGDEKPVLNCPKQPVTVRAGAASTVLDVATLCHVWTAAPGGAAGLRFSGEWASGGDPGHVAIGRSGANVSLTADASAEPLSRGTLLLTPDGFGDSVGELSVLVVTSPPPTLTSARVQTMAGVPVTVLLAGRIASPLGAGARKAILKVRPKVGTGGTRAEARGTDLVVTPASKAFHGSIVFEVDVTDAQGSDAVGRTATGTVTVEVVAPPAAPTGVHRVGDVESGAVRLGWTRPQDSGGAPVDRYKVTYNGSSIECGQGCSLTDLDNGTAYTITVQAHNAAGWGRSSAPISETPNAKPGAVPRPTVAPRGLRDGTVDVIWQPADNSGSRILEYIFFPARAVVNKTLSSATLSTGSNDRSTTFSIAARNEYGQGPGTRFTYQSSGAPAQPPAPSFTATSAADGSRVVVLSGYEVGSANGPGSPSYRVERSTQGAGSWQRVCRWQELKSCRDKKVSNDGRTYAYRVQARNQTELEDPGRHVSPVSASTQMEAAWTPEKVTISDLQPTGANGTATITFDVGHSNGVENTVTCKLSGAGSCQGSWTFPTGGQSRVTRTITGLNNGSSSTVTLQAHNGSSGGLGAGSEAGPSDSASVVAYGPLGNPQVSASKAGASNPNVNWSVSVDPNGRPATVRVVHGGVTNTYSTRTGRWSTSGTDNVGYGATDTIDVTVSDTGRGSTSGSASARTDARPAEVIVSKGRACGGGGGTRCTGAGSCSSPSCAYIHVETRFFTSSVSCTFDSQDGNRGFVQGRTWGASESKDSLNWYGYPGQWVRVTCGGVTGQMTWR